MQNLATIPQPHVYLDHGTVKTSSLDVATFFEKEHKNVLRDIQNLTCSVKFNALNFEPVKYTDPKGESRPMFTMTFSGFVWLVMGFTGSKAAAFKEAYINAFDAMAMNQLDEITNLQRKLLTFYERDADAQAALNPPMARKPMSDTEKLEIYRLRLGGMAFNAIATKLGRSYYSITTVLRRIRNGQFAHIQALHTDSQS